MAIYLGNQKVKPSGISKIYVGEQLVYQSGPPVDYLCFTAIENTNIAFVINGTLTTTPTIQYRINNGGWNNYTFGNSISLSVGDKCYWKGDNNSFSESPNKYGDAYIKFTSTARIAASGNIMTLLDSTGQSTTIPNMYCYSHMFQGCTSLTTAPELPATNLTDYCYSYMFNGCTSLTTAPELPATTMIYSCYSYMFQGCTSLTTASELPATSLAGYCYNFMFYNCTSLTTVPELPATTLVNYCYFGMFNGCTSLTTAPQLPATTLAYYCYRNMFEGCRSLYASDTQTSAASYAWRIPKSGTFSNTYSQEFMFYNCKGTRSSSTMAGAAGNAYTYYTQNQPVPRPIIKYLCFTAVENTNIAFVKNGTLTRTPVIQYKINDGDWNNYTFGNNISLSVGDKCYWKGDNSSFSETYNKYIKFTSTAKVAASGNIMTLLDSTGQSVTIPNTYCYYNMFYGCTSLVTAPQLPATTLAVACYYQMFQNCTSLTTAPQLPATTLASGCYQYMFRNCTSLQVSDTQTSDASYVWRIPTSGTFSNTYSQSGMFTSCKGTRSSNNMAGASGNSYTYYTQNQPV